MISKMSTDSQKIRVKIIREEIIIITKSMLAKISTPTDSKYPTMDIEGRRYYVLSWKTKPRFNPHEIQDVEDPDYELCLKAINEWELS